MMVALETSRRKKKRTKHITTAVVLPSINYWTWGWFPKRFLDHQRDVCGWAWVRNERMRMDHVCVCVCVTYVICLMLCVLAKTIMTRRDGNPNNNNKKSPNNHSHESTYFNLFFFISHVFPLSFLSFTIRHYDLIPDLISASYFALLDRKWA